jgi:hypothetical protein
MPVTISGDGVFAGLTTVETVNVLHPDSEDVNIVLADDGTIVLDSIPASIQSELDALDNAIDNIPVLAGIGSNVVQTVKTDTFSTTSTSFTAVTGMSASITPTSASSKILIIVDMSVSSNVDQSGIFVRLTKGGSALYVGAAAGSRTLATYPRVGFGTGQFLPLSIVYLDSPATTSSVSYEVEMARQGGAGSVHVNRNDSDTDSSVQARGASSFTVIEVAA